MSRRELPATYLARVLREKYGETNAIAQCVSRARRLKYELGETTVRDLLYDKEGKKNPGIYTLEAIAAGVDVPVAEFISHWLPDPIEARGFSESRFAVIWNRYTQLANSEKHQIDAFVEMLIDRIDKLLR